MAKFCSRCGSEIKDNVAFCSNCGSQVDSTNSNLSDSGSSLVVRRDIAIAVILSIVTCGIYGIYWFIVMTDDANRVSAENDTSGGLALLFTILTCGIYFIYWNYRMGKKMYEAGQKHNKGISDNSVLYLVLSLFGFSIVNYCLIQSDLNKFE